MTITQGGMFAILLATLLVPGLAVGAAAGLRGWLLAGTAPLLTYGVIAIAAPIVPPVFGRWSVATFGLSVAAVCVVLFLIRLAARRWTGTMRLPDALTTRWLWPHHAGVAAALIFTAALGMFVVSRATMGFTAVHQFWDAIFHANVTRFIVDTGRSAPGDLAEITPTKLPFYYPNAFHVQLATALMIDDGPMVDLLNLRAGITAGLFGLAMVALVRQVTGRPALAAAVGALCAAFSVFPSDLAYFGPLWPFSAGVAALPAFLALFVAMIRRPHPAMVAVTSLAMLGVAAIHLSVALAAGVFGAAFLVQRWLSLRRVPLRDLAVLAVPSVIAVIAVLPTMLVANRNASVQAIDWPVISNPGSALGMLLFLDHDSRYPQWWLVAAMAAGVLAIRQLTELSWWLAGGVVFSALYVMAAAYEGPLVALLTGPWWNDRWRFLALVAPVLITLAGNGLVFVRDFVLQRLQGLQRLQWLPGPLRSGVVWRGAALFAVVALLGVLSNGMYREHNVQRIAAAYTDGPTLSGQEQAALAELARLVPTGATVMNDPDDGSAWMWALYGIRPVYGQPLIVDAVGRNVDADRVLLYDRFDQLDTDSRVRDTVRRLRIQYVFIGAGFTCPTCPRAPGMDALDLVHGLDKVFSNNAASIYRVGLDSQTGP